VAVVRARRVSALFLVISLVVSACSADDDAMSPPTSGDEALPGMVEDPKAVRLRSFNLGKSINRSVGKASGAIERGFDEAGGALTRSFAEATVEVGQAGRTAMSSVVDAAEQKWRDASGRIIDGAGNLISFVPLSWPGNIGRQAAGQAVNAARGQIDAGLKALDSLGEGLVGLSASEAERRINDLLGGFDVSFPRLSIPGVGQAYVPASNPLYVRIRQSQWDSANAANVKLDLDFFGIMRYRIGVGCIGFPNGFSAAPRIALNGGCDNPWNLKAPANIVADTARLIVDDVAEFAGAIPQHLNSLLQAASANGNNPRLVPAVLVDLFVNRLLGMCCSLGFGESSVSYEYKLNNLALSGQAEFENANNVAVLDILSELAVSGFTVDTQEYEAMERKALMIFGVPELQGVDFSIPADISLLGEVSENWAGDGTIQLTVELGLFGLFVASVGLGCMTFGESWTAAPTFTFSGGCDNSWNVSFNGGGYTSSPVRREARIENGASAPPAAAPPIPPLPSVATSTTGAQGGNVVTYVQNGIKYQAHVFTLDSGNEFVVPPEMENVPVEYFIVAGGGSGASNRTRNKTGSGGGGAGGILHNINGQPLYLAAGTYQIIVGAGGTASYNEGDGLNGGNSSINGLGLIAIGGGGGGRMDNPGRNGGSGGGAGFRSAAGSPGFGQARQGNNGGNGFRGCSGDQCSAGGGGGGVGGAGGNATKNLGGNGGPGAQFSMDGVQRWYAAGGGGGGNSGGSAGSEVAGNGGRQKTDGGDAAPNSGSGGGGAGSGDNQAKRGGLGGSGIVIIRYQVR